MSAYLTEPDKLEDYNTIEPGSPVDYKREQYQELRDNNPVPVLPLMNYKSAAIPQQKPQTGNLHDPDSNIQSMQPIQSLPGRVAARDTVNQLQELSYTPPPKPKYDTKNPEYLKRAAKMSRIGEGLGVLGKAAILAMGGTVPQAKVNTAPREYMNQYMSLMDRQQQMENQYNLTEWQAKQNYDRQRIADQFRKEDIDYRNQRTSAEEKRYEQQEAKRAEMYEDQKKRDERDYKLREENSNKDNTRADESLKLQKYSTYARANRSGTVDKDDKPVTISTKYGDVEISASKASQLRHQALQNADALMNTRKELFDVTPEADEFTKMPTGKNIVTVKKDIDEEDLIRAMIELEYEQQQQAPAQQAGVQNALKSWGVTEPKSNTQVPLRAGAAPAQVNLGAIPKTADSVMEKYKKYGIGDINKETAISIANKIGYAEGILNPNTPPDRTGTKWVNDMTKQINQDRETLRASDVIKGVGYNTTAPAKPASKKADPFDF